MMAQIKTVFIKEWKDSWRDRRALLAILAFALLSPALMGGLLWKSAERVKNADLPSVSIAGSQHAPDIVTYLENRGFTVNKLSEVTYEDSLPTVPEDSEALIVLDDAFSENYQGRLPATIHVYGDMEKGVHRIAVSTVEYTLRLYGQVVAESRLVGHGVAPMITIPFVVDKSDLSNAGAQTKGMATMFLMLFLLAPFYGSMSIALDAMAGERERDSMQPLLAQPVHAFALASGKWLAAAFFGFLCTLVVTVGCSLVLANAPLASLGIRLVLDVTIVSGVIILLVPLVLMVAALQLYISLRAKNFKEGQMYLGMLVLVPSMAIVYSSMSEDGVEGWITKLPILGDQNTLSTLLTTGEFNLLASAPSLILNIVIAVLMIFFTAKHLGSEKLLDEG